MSLAGDFSSLKIRVSVIPEACIECHCQCQYVDRRQTENERVSTGSFHCLHHDHSFILSWCSYISNHTSLVQSTPNGVLTAHTAGVRLRHSVQHMKKIVRAGDCLVIVAQWAEHCHLKSGAVVRFLVATGFRSLTAKFRKCLHCWIAGGLVVKMLYCEPTFPRSYLRNIFLSEVHST